MKTPFPDKFVLDSFEITRQIVDRGYIILSQNPMLNTLSFYVDETNDILASDFSIIEVSLDNFSLYLDASMGQYILTWLEMASSSSSSGFISNELISILEERIGDIGQIRYISNN